MKPVYIFDLDGTLSLADHRIHHIRAPKCKYCHGTGFRDADKEFGPRHCEECEDGFEKEFKPNWQSFFAECINDEPNWPVIKTMLHLAVHNEIWIWTGRSDEVHWLTHKWLRQFAINGWHELLMRKEGDHTPDHLLKRGWLEGLSGDDRKRILAVFEDRQQVVDMWRGNGIACFQVAKGDF